MFSDAMGVKLLKSIYGYYTDCHLLSQNKRLVIAFFSELVIHSIRGYNVAER